MRAVVHDRYGPPEVLRLEDVERPGPEGRRGPRQDPRHDGQPDGLRLAQREAVLQLAIFTGLRRPKRRILGMELAGEVEAVGAAVTEFEVGDRVFGVKGFGAHAEFVCVRESAPLAHKPAGMTFEEAAAVCDGACIALLVPRGRRISGRGGASSSTAPPAPSAPRRCSSPGTSARTSPPCATRRTSSSCDRSEPTRSSTTCRRTSRRTARPTTSSSTPSASTRSGAADAR